VQSAGLRAGFFICITYKSMQKFTRHSQNKWWRRIYRQDYNQMRGKAFGMTPYEGKYYF
jgi:hypothetical protein